MVLIPKQKKFFALEDTVHHRYASRSQTINKEYYFEVVKDWVMQKSATFSETVTGFFNTIAFIAACAAFFNKIQCRTAAPPSLQYLYLLSILKIENASQRRPIRRQRDGLF